MRRRYFLKNTMSTGVIALAVSSGLLVPGQIFAAWNKAAFDAKDVSSAMKNALGTDSAITSDKINIEAPDIAENGAVVPITISSTLDNVKSFTIISEKSSAPLIAKFNLDEGAHAYVSTRIKMGKSSNIIVICEANGKFYKTSTAVKVTVGGCGG